MKSLLILSHPTFDKSLANKTIINELQRSKQDIIFRHLDAIYSGYQIDVAAEQALLLDADTIIFQFPFYWYSSPASLKNWLDAVLTFNFAYGPEGDKLKGKNLLLSITVGGPQEAYNALGYNHFRLPQMLVPFEQTAYLCGLNFLDPIYTHRSIYIPGVYNVKEEVEERAKNHATRVITRLQQLESIQ